MFFGGLPEITRALTLSGIGYGHEHHVNIKSKMKTKPKHTIVILPDNSDVEVSYFCTDQDLPEKQKENSTDLVIQMHDCHYPLRINKSVANDDRQLEHVVQQTVINARGHLCG